MEEYEDMESNALVAYNATGGTDAIAATMEGQEQEEVSERLQIVGSPDLQMERRKLRNTGVLKATSGNATKRKAKTETRHSTKGSTSLTTLKMIAKQGADEKSQLEEWKADLLHKLTGEIAQIHKAHDIAIEAQREEMEGQRGQFQFEIHVLGERIRALELEKEGSPQRQTWRSESVEMSPERQISQTCQNVQKRSSQPALAKELAQSNHANTSQARTMKNQAQPTTQRGSPENSAEAQERRAYSSGEPAQNSGEENATLSPIHQRNGQRTYAAVGIETRVRFSRVQYTPSGSILALLTEKADAAMLIPSKSNLLIRAAKSVDEAVVGVEVLEQ